MSTVKKSRNEEDIGAALTDIEKKQPQLEKLHLSMVFHSQLYLVAGTTTMQVLRVQAQKKDSCSKQSQ